MPDLYRLLGVAEILTAVLLVGATVTLDTFTPGSGVTNPLPWRLLAIFMIIEGADKIRR